MQGGPTESPCSTYSQPTETVDDCNALSDDTWDQDGESTLTFLGNVSHRQDSGNDLDFSQPLEDLSTAMNPQAFDTSLALEVPSCSLKPAWDETLFHDNMIDHRGSEILETRSTPRQYHQLLPCITSS